MAKQRRTTKRRPAAKPKRRAPASETLARRFVAAWRRDDEPDLDLAKRLDARGRAALYRALIRIANKARSETEVVALIVRAIELQTIVEVATAGRAKLAALSADD
jgi:hypothetical protein